MMNAFQQEYLAPAGQLPAEFVLIVEDDKQLMQCLARAMEARGFKVLTAELVFDGLAQIRLSAPNMRW